MLVSYPEEGAALPAERTRIRPSYLEMHRGLGKPRLKFNTHVKKDVLHNVAKIPLKAKDRQPATILGQGAYPASSGVDPKSKKSIKFRFQIMGGGKHAKILSSPEKRALKAAKASKIEGNKRAKGLLVKAKQKRTPGYEYIYDIPAPPVGSAIPIVEGKRSVKLSRKLSGMMVSGVADMHFLHRSTSPQSSSSREFVPRSSPSSSSKKKRVHSVQSTSRRVQSTSPSPARVPRQFVLPQISSRSSRVIKPNKRFIEEVGEESPSTSKHVRLDIDDETIMSHEMEHEWLDSGEEFVSPEGFKKPLPRTGDAVVARTNKVVSTKVKKIFCEKQHKAVKAAQLVKKSRELERAGKKARMEAKHKERVKAKKTRLLEKKREKKQRLKEKKLETKRKKKEKIQLVKAKKKAKEEKSKAKKKSGKSPKKHKDKDHKDETKMVVEKDAPDDDDDDDDVFEDIEDPFEDIDDDDDDIDIPDSNDKDPDYTPASILDKPPPIDSSPEFKTTSSTCSKKKSKKSAKRKLKEEAKQLKKSYNDLKKVLASSKQGTPIRDPLMFPDMTSAGMMLSVEDVKEDTEKRRQLKDLAKRHKDVCRALRKLQKENIPHITSTDIISKDVISSSHKETKRKGKNKKSSKNLADKILKKAKERMGISSKEQKENLGPLSSPTELSSTSFKAMAESANKAIADLGKWGHFVLYSMYSILKGLWLFQVIYTQF